MFKILELFRKLIFFNICLYADEEGGGMAEGMDDGVTVEEAPQEVDTSTESEGSQEESEESEGSEDSEDSEESEEGEETEESETQTQDKTPKWMKREIFLERERRRELERELDRLKQEQQPKKQEPEYTDINEPEEPDPDDFDDVNEYKKAEKQYKKNLRAYDRAQIKKEIIQETQRTQKDQQLQTLASDWAAKERDAVKKKPDYYDVVDELKANLGNDQKGQFIFQSILKSRDPDLAYHLGANPETIQKIKSHNDPGEVLMAIGEVKASLGTPKKTHVSKKPAPIKKPKGGGSTKDDKPKVEDSDDEWIRKRNLQLAKKKGIKVA